MCFSVKLLQKQVCSSAGQKRNSISKAHTLSYHSISQKRKRKPQASASSTGIPQTPSLSYLVRALRTASLIPVQFSNHPERSLPWIHKGTWTMAFYSSKKWVGIESNSLFNYGSLANVHNHCRTLGRVAISTPVTYFTCIKLHISIQGRKKYIYYYCGYTIRCRQQKMNL